MGSSPQKSSGVHWCRRWVRFNEAPKFPEKVWEASVQSPVRFRVPEKVPEKVLGSLAWCKAKSGSTGFRRKFPEKVPEKVGEALVQSQVRFNRVP